jgi:hypothetical protein
MILLAIDPGSEQSALVWYSPKGHMVLMSRKYRNEDVLEILHAQNTASSRHIDANHLAIEMAESFGAKVWAQVFETVLWTGRFVEAWGGDDFSLVTRREVKLHVTGSGRAKDGQVRQCLIERWGGQEVAIGTKVQPGPLHNVKADQWAALAIAATWGDRRSA